MTRQSAIFRFLFRHSSSAAAPLSPRRCLLALVLAMIAPQICADAPPEWLTGDLPRALALSPDGSRLAWAEGEILHLALLAELPAATASQPGGRIENIWWQGDGLLVQASDDHQRLMRLDAAGALERTLVALPIGAYPRIQVLQLRSGHLLAAMDERLRFQPDVYRIDTATGERRMLERNPGRIIGWVADEHGRIRAAQRWEPSSRAVHYEWLVRTGSMWQAVRSFELGQTEEHLLSVTDRGLLFASVGEAGSALHWLDPVTRQMSAPVWQEAGVVQGVVDAGAEGPPGLITVEANRQTIWTSAPQWSGRLGQLREHYGESSFRLLDRTRDDQLLLWQVDNDRHLPRHVVQRDDSLQELDLQGPGAVQGRPMVAFDYAARDGRRLDGYVTRPAGGKPAPGVVLVHGGPWARDSWGFDAEAQFLSQLGYAVLQVNFRGSRGLGPDRLLAGRRQWGRAMQDDLIDAVDFAAAQGWVDAQRVCIMGASYGGYAALMAAATAAETFRCAVARAPVVDLEQHLQSIRTAGNRRGYLEWREMVGPPGTLEAISPISHAGATSLPVLLAHGTEDHVAAISHSRRYSALVENVEYLELPGEGHQWRTEAGRRHYYSAVARFLEQHLGPFDASPEANR